MEMAQNCVLRDTVTFVSTKCILNDQLMEDVMGGACGTHEDENKSISNFKVET